MGYRKYRYRNTGDTIFKIFLLIIIIAGIFFGVKYKNEIKIFAISSYNKHIVNNSKILSLEDAEAFFYSNKDTFEQYIEEKPQNTLYINNNYISIIDRYDFGGNQIRAFRFQNKEDIGTEIIYSINDLQESSILKEVEKHWYVYNYVNN